jgi:hypothetical protein
MHEHLLEITKRFLTLLEAIGCILGLFALGFEVGHGVVSFRPKLRLHRCCAE